MNKRIDRFICLNFDSRLVNRDTALQIKYISWAIESLISGFQRMLREFIQIYCKDPFSSEAHKALMPLFHL